MAERNPHGRERPSIFVGKDISRFTTHTVAPGWPALRNVVTLCSSCPARAAAEPGFLSAARRTRAQAFAELTPIYGLDKGLRDPVGVSAWG
jgi:hypothetical protein